VKKEKSRKLNKAIFARLSDAVRIVWRCGRGLTLVNFFLLILQGLLPLAGLYIIKLLIDAVTSAITAPDKAMAFERVIFLIFLAGAVFVLTFLCKIANSAIREALQQITSDQINDLLHAKSIELDLEYYESSDYYDKLDLAKREATYRPTLIVGNLATMVEFSVTLVALVGLLCAFHWSIPLILFFAILPGAIVRSRYGDALYKWRVRRAYLERRASYLHNLLLEDRHVKEIRLFDLGSLLKDRFLKIRKQLLKERIKIITKRSFGDLVLVVGGTLAVLGCYSFIAYRTVYGVTTLGDLVMYLGAFQRGQQVLQYLIAAMIDLYENSLFLTSLYDFLNLKRHVIEPANPKPVSFPMQRGISFHNVSFCYPHTSRFVLRDINFTIKPGEVIGLVGENGSGKTTLVKLLCRFYDPTKGSITFDGVDFREFETTALRRHISMIFQDYSRFHTTIRENIWFGDITLPHNDPQIAEAANKAGADEMISGFKKGYDTVLGKWFEYGEELSIGELQKLALARAVFRNAQIMLLDEPTSSMDSKAEYELFKRFRELASGRTVILISHRLSTLKMADLIYVLRDETIVESGTHDELVANGGTYAELFETQAQAYR
jgi:ATP-binding cassette subfamily B protein